MRDKFSKSSQFFKYIIQVNLKVHLIFIVPFFLFLSFSVYAKDEFTKVVRLPENGIELIFNEVTVNYTPSLKLTIKRNDKIIATWSHDELYLDEEGTEKKIHIVKSDKNTFLIVNAFSGGAHCCWSLLVYDLDNIKFLGEFLNSYNSIKIKKKVESCSNIFLIKPVKVADDIPPYLYPTAGYCFKDGSFIIDKSSYMLNLYRNEFKYAISEIGNEAKIPRSVVMWLSDYYLEKFPNDIILKRMSDNY